MLTALYILIVIFLVLANGFFVASEFSLVGVRRSRIVSLAESGNRQARRVLHQLDHLNAYISATQLGITMASLALGWIGEPAFAHVLEGPLRGRVSDAWQHTIAFTMAFSLITFLHIVIGELAPKTLALERTEKIALAIAWPLQIFYKVFRWPIRMLDWAGTRTVRLFGLHPTGAHASIYTEDELRQLVEVSHQSGHLELDEKKLINRVFDFADTTVREAMVPRTGVAALPLNASLAEARKAFRGLGYSRMPVYRERIDEVAGVLFRRDLEPYLEDHALAFNLESLLHPAVFIPESARLGAVLKEMQKTRAHLACVVNEHGGMEGIITLEDLLEEIVGEINDEFDEELRSQIVKDGDHYLLDGMLAVRDANRALQLKIPERAEYTTMAGFMMDQAGRLLNAGDFVHYNGSRFTVERIEQRRIRRIRLELVPRVEAGSVSSAISVIGMALMSGVA